MRTYAQLNCMKNRNSILKLFVTSGSRSADAQLTRNRQIFREGGGGKILVTEIGRGKGQVPDICKPVVVQRLAVEVATEVGQLD